MGVFAISDISDRERDSSASILSSLPEGASFLGEDLTIKLTNQKLKEMFKQLKLTTEQISPGNKFPELLLQAGCAKKTIEEIKDEIEIIIDGEKEEFKKEVAFEVENIKRWYKLKITGYMDGALILQEDITDRKLQNTERKKLLEEYETIFYNVQSCIFLLNVEDEQEITFQKFNPREEELLGLTTEEVKGKTPIEVFGEETGRKVEKEYRKCLARREKIEYEEKLVFPGGTYIWHTILAPVIIEGRVEKIVGTARDITEERREKLKADALFENSTSAVAMLDSEGNIVDINDEFQEVFGYKLPEVRGEHLDEVLEWGKEGYADREATEEFLEGEKKRGEGTRYDKWGNPREFLFHGIPIEIEGEVEGAYTLYDDITELQREKEKLEKTRRELRETKDQLEAILESIQDGIAVMNPDLTIRYTNSTMKDWYAESTPLKGKKCHQVYHNKEEPCSNCHILKTLETGETAGKIEQSDHNSQAHYLELYSYPMIDDETGEITGIVELSRDITEHKKAKKELEMTKFSLDNANMMILRVSPEGIIRYVNTRVCEKLGYKKDELIGRKASQLVPEDFPLKNRSEFWQNIKNSGSYVYERDFETKGGTSFPVSLISQYFEYEGEEYEMVFARDITERKEMEKELKIKEQQYRKIFETSPVGILVQDKNGNILEVNDKLCEITNYSKDELEGSSVFETLVPPEIEERARKNIKRILAGEDLTLTEESRSKDGKFYYVRLEETKFKLPGGEEGVLSMHLDITELKEKEENLKYLSYHDGLTDLFNRSYLEEEMERLNTERQLPISLIMCDVNGMKIINDTYGHKKGDEVLIKVADILRQCTRDEDIVSRWAGDEFVILLPQTNLDTARKISRRIEKVCEGAEFKDIPITLGMGIAAKKDLNEEFQEILARADEKMYKDKLTKAQSAENKLVQNMLNTLAAKSQETTEHAMRMTELAHSLGKEMGLSNEQLNNLSLLASLHDIGKTTISEDILTKPGRLTEEEWEIIKEHPERGYTIASATEEFAPIAKAVLHHHEKWNGEGYPQGLKENDIPLLSRVIAIVDAYDVMTTGRPYKEAMSKKEALEEIEDCAGSHFDPELAKKFVNMMKE